MLGMRAAQASPRKEGFLMERSLLYLPPRETAAGSPQHRARILSPELLTAQENERKRISRELHDGLGQMLSAIKFRLESNLSRKERVASNWGKQVSSFLHMIQECIDETRRIQMDLRPPVLDDLGILATVNWFAREFASTYSSIRTGENE